MNRVKRSNGKMFSLMPLLLAMTSFLMACGGGSVAPQASNPSSTEPDPGPPGITLLAGTLGGAGDEDGVGSLARFNNIKNFTTDASGNLYVTTSDRNANGLQAIRKVTPEGLVTTLLSSKAGNVDGDRSIAKISNPGQIVVDSKANLFFIDDNGVRKLTSNGTLSTLTPLSKACTADSFRCEGFIHIFQDMLFIFDANVIYKIDQDGGKTIFAGQKLGTADAIDGTGTNARFAHIVAVSLDSDRGFILFDQAKIRRVSANAEVTTVGDGVKIYLSRCAFPNIRDLTVNAQNDLVFISECTHVPGFGREWVIEHTQYKLNASGEFTLMPDLILLPNGIQGTWPEKTYLVIKNEIWFKDAEGKEKHFAGLNEERVLKDGKGNEARFKDAKAIAADLAGNVYVAENPDSSWYSYKGWQGWSYSNGLTVRKVNQEGNVTTLNSPETPSGNISGIAVDKKGNIYVSSVKSSSLSSFAPGIYKITPNGAVTVFAGATEMKSGFIEGEDGLAEQASFSSSLSLLGFDRDGNLYANDQKGGKATIRKLTPSGVVSTISALPTGFGADALGNVYSIGADKTSILRTGPDQKVSLVAGAVDNHSLKLGPLPGNLSYITGLARTGPRSFAVLNDARVLKLVIP